MSQQTWTPLRGYPDWLILGGRILTFFGDPPISGGRGGGVQISLLVLYIGRGFGGPPVTNRRGGGYRTLPPYPRLVPSTIGPGVSGDDFQ